MPIADERCDVDLGAELQQLDRAEKGEDHADQEADQADDRQRLRAHLLDGNHEVGVAKARLAPHQPAQRQRDLAEESDHVAAPLDQPQRLLADLVQGRIASRGPLRPGALRHRRGELQQPAHAVGQTARIRLQPGAADETVQTAQKSEQAAVPIAHAAGLEHHPPEIASRLELSFHIGRCRQGLAQPPAA